MRYTTYRSPDQLANDIESISASQAGRAAIAAGLSSWFTSSIVPVRRIVRDDDQTRDRRKRYTRPWASTGLIAQTTPVGCGETNTITYSNGARGYYQSIAGEEAAVLECIADCNNTSLEAKMTSIDSKSGQFGLLHNLGASFGNAFNTYVLKGNPEMENWYGLFNHPVFIQDMAFKDFGAEYTTAPDLSDTTKYDESALARYFFNKIRYFDRPKIKMGPIQMELIGGSQRSTEVCMERWQCMLAMLRQRGVNTDNLFVTIESYDYVYGIDPANPDTPHGIIQAIDEANVGAAADDIDSLQASRKGSKHAEKIFWVDMGGLEVDRHLTQRTDWNAVPFNDKISPEYDKWYDGLTAEQKPVLDLR